MSFAKHVRRDEKGQVLTLSLIILALGCLTVTPLLNFVSTNVKSTISYQNKMKQSYACDAGVEDSAYKMVKNVPSIQALGDGDSWTYTLPSINGIPVTVKITKLSLLDGLLGSDEYKIGQPHAGWVQYQVPAGNVTRNYDEDWVEYYATLDFEYLGNGNRMVESVGVFFAPFPGDANLIQNPYNEVAIPVMNFVNLKSMEKKVVTGGFAFIYRWFESLGPQFTNQNRTGGIRFNFRVNDADWGYASTFMWVTFKEQDVSYLTNLQLNKWLIEVSAGQTTTKVQALEDEASGSVTLLSWERR